MTQANDPVIAQIMSVFGAMQGRIEALENQVRELTQKNASAENQLASLNLWHNLRLFGRIGKLYPKRRSVVFYHRDFFCDNIKYAFLRCMEAALKHGFDCHFMMHDDSVRTLMQQHGLPVLPPAKDWTMAHYDIILSAKVLVVQDDFTPYTWQPSLSYFLLQGAKLVQLWHGIPMKEIGVFYKASAAAGTHEFKFAATGPADVLTAPGKNFKEEWRKWVTYRDFAVTGYPRNDVLLRDPTPNELINVDIDLLRDVLAAKEAGKKVIFYGPTFRDPGGLGWLMQAKIDRLASWCREQGHVFVTKPHPLDPSIEELVKAMPDVRFAHSRSDIYPLLRHADLFITDYSSLMFDFLLVDRPVLFYRPDHQAYLAKCRNMLPHHERMTVGAVAEDMETLIRNIADALVGKQAEWEKPRRALRDELYDHIDAKAGDRVVMEIVKQLDAPEEQPTGWAP